MRLGAYTSFHSSFCRSITQQVNDVVEFAFSGIHLPYTNQTRTFCGMRCVHKQHPFAGTELIRLNCENALEWYWISLRLRMLEMKL